LTYILRDEAGNETRVTRRVKIKSNENWIDVTNDKIKNADFSQGNGTPQRLENDAYGKSPYY